MIDFFNRVWNKMKGTHLPQPEPVIAHIPDDDLTIEIKGASGWATDSARRLRVVAELLERQRDLKRGDRNAAKL